MQSMYKKDPLGNDIPSTEAASSQRGSVITPEMANITSRCPLVPPPRLSGAEIPAAQKGPDQPFPPSLLWPHLPSPSKNSPESPQQLEGKVPAAKTGTSSRMPDSILGQARCEAAPGKHQGLG